MKVEEDGDLAEMFGLLRQTRYKLEEFYEICRISKYQKKTTLEKSGAPIVMIAGLSL